MGCMKKPSGSPLGDYPKRNLNPDPSNYKIIDSIQFENALVVSIKYPNCTNYEGNKILVYLNTTLEELKAQKHIDPHFFESKKFKAPFARFEPTMLGWEAALRLAGNWRTV